MTPAKTVREQVEHVISRWHAALREYDSLTGPDGAGPSAQMIKCEDRLGDIRYAAACLVNEHASLFAAAEETAAQLASLTKERDELREAMEAAIAMFPCPNEDRSKCTNHGCKIVVLLSAALSRQTEGK